MLLRIKFLPVVSNALKIALFILFLIVFITINYLYTTYGIIAIIVSSPIYAVMMILLFYTLASKFIMVLNKDEGKLFILKPFKKIEIDISQINTVELYELKKSFVLSISYKNKIQNFALSGPLDFEEPQILSFLKALHDFNQNIKFGGNVENIIHGSQTLQIWSNKMYYLYWYYISTMIFSYILLLLLIFIIKKI
ncbi:hypothetical protein A2V49_02840 [candidate division WWE3 bacterium RBG_19FT_COMBO_34_6]|uniref:Uncharacterized protein n=1 Tax=candidate division WWE3 bacterium RBG_19FT_COMBO_34_6 TaxID=1802612 RepID=A0A1F4UNB4_UNCKA|nr:MAG: hypothetical protein A2V49_02840 [candidate division WWE3 bacterium RBG_19FT_COMBO_34_6]